LILTVPLYIPKETVAKDPCLFYMPVTLEQGQQSRSHEPAASTSHPAPCICIKEHHNHQKGHTSVVVAFRRTEGNTMAQKDRGESESLKKDRGFTVRNRTELKNEHPKCTSSCGLFLICRKKRARLVIM
jgi:hypothetical protein